MIYALIPAAGKSTRMGGKAKLALRLGDRSVLEHVIVALQRGGVEHILVVVGPHVPELVTLVEAARAQALLLPAETPDMRTTIEAGLGWLEDRHQPNKSDSWLLVPGDHPTLDAAVVKLLIQSRREHLEKSIFVPSFQGKRGHPTLIGWQYVPEIRNRPRDEGINKYLRDSVAETQEVPVASATILADLDTPGDYERLVKGWTQLH